MRFPGLAKEQRAISPFLPAGGWVMRTNERKKAIDRDKLVDFFCSILSCLAGNTCADARNTSPAPDTARQQRRRSALARNTSKRKASFFRTELSEQRGRESLFFFPEKNARVLPFIFLYSFLVFDNNRVSLFLPQRACSRACLCGVNSMLQGTEGNEDRRVSNCCCWWVEPSVS